MFTWTKQRDLAAVLVAEDTLTNEQIAAQIGIKRQTLDYWKRQPIFHQRVEEILVEFRQMVRQRGIAVMENRVAALQDRWGRMKQVIAERAADPDMQDVPGGKTGLMVHQVKGVGKGEDFQLIDLYAVDAGLLAEMRAHEQQAARELGQWTEKRDLTSGGKPIGRLPLEELTDDELDRRIAEAEGREAPSALPEAP